MCLLRQSHKVPVVIIDASAGGFCVLSKHQVETGEIIHLDLDAIGTFDCQVRWVATDRFGVQIIDGAHELTTVDVDNLAQALDLVSGRPPAR